MKLLHKTGRKMTTIEGPGSYPVYVKFWAVFIFAHICLIFGM